MRRNVLIVDDDQVLRHLVTKHLARYEDTFIVLTAEDGMNAIQILKNKPISLVITDLQMPKMDGFGLLAHLSANYPDIPVLIITAYDKPATKQKALQGGAAGYIKKPFDNEELSRRILEILNKELEGGTLHNVSLETFIQLVEMEQKTCTIRVIDKASGNKGVLFFKDGELLNARINDVQGNSAAYEIFSWDKPTLAIENDCAQKNKNIEGDLQGILLEAMRLKDESAAKKAITSSKMPSKKSTDINKQRSKETSSSFKKEAPILSHAEIIKDKIEKLVGDRRGIEDIYEDSTAWNGLMEQFKEMGNRFDAGDFKVCFFDTNDTSDFIIAPGIGNEKIIITVNHQCPRDRIIQVLGE
ncbi:MAG: response regulator [Desulfobacterales bacterium]|nr:response regulator [Desulfobacterales bacterium]MBF0396333.1 response regulator [Desulfobacterales bacterium]